MSTRKLKQIIDSSESSEDSYDVSEEIHSDNESSSESVDQAILDKYEDNDIRNIMFETINDTYSRGKFGPFEIIMMSENGYVNATKLCNGAGKEFRQWYRLKKAVSYREYVKNQLKWVLKVTSLTINISNGKCSLRGTYVHPDLIVAIAQWCSNEYAYMVNKLMIEYHSRQALEEKQAILKENGLLKKDNRSLMAKVDKLLEDNKELLAINKEQLARLEENAIALDELHDKNDEIHDKLTNVCRSRVIDGKSAKMNILTIVKNNAKPIKPKKNDPPYYEYKVFRTARRNLSSLYKTHKEKYPKYEEVFRIDYTPNSVQLWQRFVEKYGHSIDCNGCSFNLEDVSLKKTLSRIKRVHNSRYDTE